MSKPHLEEYLLSLGLSVPSSVLGSLAVVLWHLLTPIASVNVDNALFPVKDRFAQQDRVWALRLGFWTQVLVP